MLRHARYVRHCERSAAIHSVYGGDWTDSGAQAGFKQPYEKIVQLKLAAPDGNQRDTDCAETGTLLRIVQSIPGPKPSASGAVGSTAGAYPRSRGGTFSCDIAAGSGAGLSPLARGNQDPMARRALRAGPIPARAGEPC